VGEERHHLFERGNVKPEHRVVVFQPIPYRVGGVIKLKLNVMIFRPPLQKPKHSQTTAFDSPDFRQIKHHLRNSKAASLCTILPLHSTTAMSPSFSIPKVSMMPPELQRSLQFRQNLCKVGIACGCGRSGEFNNAVT
jgi:hypothetical protein